MLLEHQHVRIVNLVANIVHLAAHALTAAQGSLQQIVQVIFQVLLYQIPRECVFIPRKRVNALQQVLLQMILIVEKACVFKVAIIATASTVLDLQQPYVISLMASV